MQSRDLGPTISKVVKVPECIQRRAPKLGKGLEGMSSGEQLRSWSSLARRRLRGGRPHGSLQLPEEGKWRGRC